MGKLILFSNQKGGCGKTTNCIQFANYLTQKGKSVFVLDCDFQRSIYDRRQDDLKNFELDEDVQVWGVEAVELEKLGSIVEQLKQIEEETYILVDMAGKVDDPALFPLFHAANYIIVPFSYDKVTIDSTGMFIKLIEFIDVKAPLFFLPNRVKKVVKYEDVEKTNDILMQYGTLCPEVNDRRDMERVYTLFMTKEAKEIVAPAYDFISEKLK